MKTVREQTIGKATVRLLQNDAGYVGFVMQGGKRSDLIEGDDAEIVWRRLLADVGKAHPSYFGYDGAKVRFLKYFPKAFEDPGYLFHERNYKDEAVTKISALLPLEMARTASAADCAAAMKAFTATNLVFQIEKARIRGVLTSAQGAAYLRAAARFADGELKGGLDDMLAAIRATTSPSWPMLTYLPFFWRPTTHMFLKPEVTRDFAERVGHPFARDYSDGLVPSTYESLLDLAAETERHIADLKPTDRIDVQSFIWVVGAYDE